jgi:hypothetical protein
VPLHRALGLPPLFATTNHGIIFPSLASVCTTRLNAWPLLPHVAAPPLPLCCSWLSAAIPFTSVATAGAWSSHIDDWVALAGRLLATSAAVVCQPSAGATLSWLFLAIFYFFHVFLFSLCFAALFVFCCLFVLWVAIS